MRIHLQVGLGLLNKYLHFILIKTFVAAELQLGGALLKVHVADGVTDVAAPVAGLCPLKARPSAR